jgi:hypothetical protein
METHVSLSVVVKDKDMESVFLHKGRLAGCSCSSCSAPNSYQKAFGKAIRISFGREISGADV